MKDYAVSFLILMGVLISLPFVLAAEAWKATPPFWRALIVYGIPVVVGAVLFYL